MNTLLSEELTAVHQQLEEEYGCAVTEQIASPIEEMG